MAAQAQTHHKTAIVAAVSALLCASCQNFPSINAQGPGEPEPELTTTISDTPPEPVPSPPKGPAEARPNPIPSKAVALNTPLPVRKPPVTSLNENQIVGAETATLLSLFGEPETVTTKAPSQTWFYASGPCRLFIQLFKDLDSGAFRALKYSIEGGSAERCLAQFEHFSVPNKTAGGDIPSSIAVAADQPKGR